MHYRYFNLSFLFVIIISANIVSSNSYAESKESNFLEEKTILSDVPKGYDIVPQSIQLSEDLRNVTYVLYSDQNKKIVYHNHEASPVYYAIKAGTPAFSKKSINHVYIAYKSKKGDASLVINGKQGPVFDNIDHLNFSPDGKRYAYRATKNNLQCIVVDGRPGPWYKGIPVKDNLRFSPDSKHLAYVAFKDDNCVLVLDGNEQNLSFQFIDYVRFSFNSKRIVYKGRTEKTKHNEKWCAVIDGKKGNVYDKIFDLIFSPDSKNIAYAVLKNNEMALVINGKETVFYYRYGMPVFSPDSKRLAYTYQKKKQHHLIVDGKHKGKYDKIYQFYYSPDSSRYALVVQNKKKWYCIVDDNKGPKFDSIGGFKFSPDSTHYAYAAEVDEKGLIIKNDDRGEEYQSVGEPYFSPDSKQFVYRARHEKTGKWVTILNGNKFGNYYNGIGKYFFSENSRHLAFAGLVQLGKQSVMVVDGIELNPTQKFKIIGKPFFSPDSNHIAYHVRAGKNKWKIVVDGHILDKTYGGFFKDSPIIFDSSNYFHTIALEDPGPKFLAIDVKIPKNIKIQSEI
jgi:Tol biopolymer transport system component